MACRQIGPTVNPRVYWVAMSRFWCNSRLQQNCSLFCSLLSAECATRQRDGQIGLFRCLHRRDMLLAVKDCLLGLFPLCFSAQSQRSFPFFRITNINTQEGTQHCNPLGPLLFCDSIQPLLNSSESVLTLGVLGKYRP